MLATLKPIESHNYCSVRKRPLLARSHLLNGSPLTIKDPDSSPKASPPITYSLKSTKMNPYTIFFKNIQYVKTRQRDKALEQSLKLPEIGSYIAAPYSTIDTDQHIAYPMKAKPTSEIKRKHFYLNHYNPKRQIAGEVIVTEGQQSLKSSLVLNYNGSRVQTGLLQNEELPLTSNSKTLEQIKQRPRSLNKTGSKISLSSLHPEFVTPKRRIAVSRQNVFNAFIGSLTNRMQE